MTDRTNKSKQRSRTGERNPPRASGRDCLAQATLDVRALKRFLTWSLKHNQRAADAIAQQRQALLAAMELVTEASKASSRR